MGPEEIAAPCGHDDQGRDPQLCEFGIVAEKRCRPQAKTGKRQCDRAHEFGRVTVLQENWFLRERARPDPTPSRARRMHRYSDQFRKSSENTQQLLVSRLTHPSGCQCAQCYLVPDAAAESKVSGGSKKHLCQSAASVKVPATHC